MQIVKYSRNVNPDEATAAITLNGRPNMVIGGNAMEITDEEHARLIQHVVFEYPEPGSDDYENATRIPVHSEDDEQAPAEPDDLGGKSNAELREIASQEGADISGMRSNSDIIDAIRAKRQADLTGLASLPSTAVVPVEVETTNTEDSEESGSGAGS